MEIDHELKKKTELYLNHGLDDTIIRHDNSKVTYSLFEEHDYNYKYVAVPEKAHDFGYEEDYMAIRSFLARKVKGNGPIEKEWKSEVIKTEM
jgi:predicted esterase